MSFCCIFLQLWSSSQLSCTFLGLNRMPCRMATRTRLLQAVEGTVTSPLCCPWLSHCGACHNCRPDFGGESSSQMGGGGRSSLDRTAVVRENILCFLFLYFCTYGKKFIHIYLPCYQFTLWQCSFCKSSCLKFLFSNNLGGAFQEHFTFPFGLLKKSMLVLWMWVCQLALKLIS